MSKLQQVGGVQQLLQLKSLFVRDWPKYGKEFYCLDNYLKILRKDAEIKNVQIWALPTLELGLFAIVDRYQIFMGCLESERSEDLLKESLDQLAFFGGLQCSAISHRYFKAASEVIQAKQLKIRDNLISYILILSKEEALQFEVKTPIGFSLRTLSREDAQVIDDHWKFSQPGSLFYIQRQIKFNISVGLYKEESNELVAWCIRAPDGLLATLQVKDSYKRRGFGVLIVKEFSRRVALQGDDILTEVDEDNQASPLLFRKLGFKPIDQTHWLMTESENGNFQWTDGE